MFNLWGGPSGDQAGMDCCCDGPAAGMFEKWWSGGSAGWSRHWWFPGGRFLLVGAAVVFSFCRVPKIEYSCIILVGICAQLWLRLANCPCALQCQLQGCMLHFIDCQPSLMKTHQRKSWLYCPWQSPTTCPALLALFTHLPLTPFASSLHFMP